MNSLKDSVVVQIMYKLTEPLNSFDGQNNSQLMDMTGQIISCLFKLLCI